MTNQRCYLAWRYYLVFAGEHLNWKPAAKRGEARNKKKDKDWSDKQLEGGRGRDREGEGDGEKAKRGSGRDGARRKWRLSLACLHVCMHTYR